MKRQLAVVPRPDHCSRGRGAVRAVGPIDSIDVEDGELLPKLDTVDAAFEIPVHLAGPLDGRVAETAAHDAGDAVHIAAEPPGVERVARQREVHGVGWAGVAGVVGRVDGDEDGFLAMCVARADLCFLEEEVRPLMAAEESSEGCLGRWC